MARGRPQNDVNGLTPAQERFVGLLARGNSGRQAVKMAYPDANLSNSGYDEKAAKLKRLPAIQARLGSLVDAAKIEDIYNQGRWVTDVLADVERAIKRGNETAVASYRRMLGQALGVLKDRIVLSAEQSMSDADLLKALAGDDKGKIVVLQDVLGRATFGNGRAS